MRYTTLSLSGRRETLKGKPLSLRGHRRKASRVAGRPAARTRRRRREIPRGRSERVHTRNGEFLLPREGVVGRRATSICLGRLPHQERPRIPRASITSSSYRAHRATPRRVASRRASLSVHFTRTYSPARIPSHEPPFSSTCNGTANVSKWNSRTTETKLSYLKKKRYSAHETKRNIQDTIY